MSDLSDENKTAIEMGSILSFLTAYAVDGCLGAYTLILIFCMVTIYLERKMLKFMVERDMHET